MNKKDQAEQYRQITRAHGTKAAEPAETEEELKQLSAFVPYSLFRRVKAAVAVDNEHKTIKSLLIHLLTDWLESKGK